VRERLVAGGSDEAVRDYVVARYGEFVLLNPRMSLRNALLWGTPVLILVVGAGVALVSLRRRRTAAPQGALSPAEEAALAALLKDRD